MGDKPKVLLVAAEAIPFSKVGGLAEYAGALPRALRKLGVDARLMIPRYANGQQQDAPKLHRISSSLPVPMGGRPEGAHLFSTDVDGVPVYLIYSDQHFGNRARVYGFNDDPQRFLYFSRAVLAALQTLDWVPDVIHANDWHTAAIPTWLSVYGKDLDLYKQIATLFTIHNLAYQGVVGRLLLNYGRMNSVPHLSVEPPGKLNWVAQGIVHADVVSTVSPTYAQEIAKSDTDGFGSLLRAKAEDFFGILSGIDTGLWDPAEDSALAQTFDSGSTALRSVNKTALQRELHLPADRKVPLLAMVSRLDPYKGLDVMAEALGAVLAERDCQFILLGSGDEALAQPFLTLQDQYPHNVRALLRFDDRLARRVYGGADILVVPSERESVSLGLMAGMRYGAVPIVRGVGGLVDTVTDYVPAVGKSESRGTGFVFEGEDASALREAIGRALAVIGHAATWRALQNRIMDRDFSWAVSARAYVDLYDHALRVHDRGA